MLQARLDEARAQLALVEQQLERVRLTAPFDGVSSRGSDVLARCAGEEGRGVAHAGPRARTFG